jgi:glycosyltransferase involved in cell wall biosynthesis
LVTCGSLRIYKGHHVLIRALAKMRRPADCVIIGDGPQRAFLEQLASELGVRERIEFTGALPQQKAVERYAEADVFVLASTIFQRAGRQDVIPNVLVEAMAMGLPVVSTTLPGIRELIDDGVQGRLVPPDDPQTLATVLDELLDDLPQRRRLGEEGRRRVEERFDRAKNILQLAELFAARAGSAVDFVPARD